MSRKLRKLEKQILPKFKSNKKGILIKIFKIFLLISFLTVTEIFINNAKSLLERIAPKSESLSIAIFALPVAMFGIYISILVSSAGWKNTKFSNSNYKTLYEKSNNVFDLTPVFITKIIFDTFAWIVGCFNAEHSKATAYGLFITIEFLYLIFFEIWKIHMNVEKYYVNSVINNYLIYCDNYYEKNIKQRDTIGNQIKDVKIKIRTKGDIFKNEIHPLMLAIISNNTSQAEKLAFIRIVDKMKNQAFNENNILLLSIGLDCAKDLFDDAINKKDYEYAYLLAETIISGWSNIVNKHIKLYNKTTNEIDLIIENFKKKDSLTEPIVKRIFKILCTFTARLDSLKSLVKEIDNIVDTLLIKLGTTKELNTLCYGGVTIAELQTFSKKYDEYKNVVDATVKKVNDTKIKLGKPIDF